MGGNLRRTLRGVAVVAALSALSGSGCNNPADPAGGINAVSTVVNGHSHRVTIPFSDIDNPPTNGRDYTSTTDAGHAHLVHVSAQQLLDLQQSGAALSVTSGPPIVPPTVGDNHTHLFEFVR